MQCAASKASTIKGDFPILIIVVLVLLFGGGGGILGSQSRLLVTVRFGQSCVCHTDSVHLVSL